MHTLDSWVVQMLISKLDTNACTLTEAKAHAKLCHFTATSRTKEAFIREISRAVTAKETMPIEDDAQPELFS